MTGSALPPLPADDEVERRLAALKSGAEPALLRTRAWATFQAGSGRPYSPGP